MKEAAWKQEEIIAGLFRYIGEDRRAALELYHALSGTQDGKEEEIDVTESSGAYYLAREGGAVFVFPRQMPA